MLSRCSLQCEMNKWPKTEPRGNLTQVPPSGNATEVSFQKEESSTPVKCCWVPTCEVTVCVCSVTQSFLTLCYPMDCSCPGSSFHGIFPGKNTGVGCHFLLQDIFLTRGSNLGLLPCRQILYHLSYIQGSPLEVAIFLLFLRASSILNGMILIFF